MSFICITRKPQQWIIITCPDGEKIRLAVLKHKSGGQVIIGIEAPQSFHILREEIVGTDKYKEPEKV